MALGCLPFGAGLLAYNRITTGDPLHTAYEFWWEFDRFGFGEGRGPVGRHTLEQGLANTRFNFQALADYLFGWPERLSLLLAALAAALATASLAWLGARAAVAARG